MSIEEDKRNLATTSDLQTAERIARIAIIRHAYEGGIDNNFMADALAKQRNLGFGQENEKMHKEGVNAGLFSTDGQPRNGLHGETVSADEWNSTIFYLASDFLNPANEGEITEPSDAEGNLYMELEKCGVNVEEVFYVKAENWNDGKFNFGNDLPAENPGIYRVWVRVGKTLGKMVDEKTRSGVRQIK